MSFEPPFFQASASTLRPQPGSLEYINRPNPVEPSNLTHGTFDGSARELDRTTNEQLHPFLLGNRLLQRKDLGPDATRLHRYPPNQPSGSPPDDDSSLRSGENFPHRRDLDQAVFTLPKLPAKRHAKRHRVPPVLQGLHQPPAHAGLLPSISTDDLQAFLSAPRSTPSASGSNVDQEVTPVAVQQQSPLASETLPEVPAKRSRRNLWTDQETTDLLAGVARFGIGSWKKILFCPDYQFDKRTAVDLKDRFRVCCPDEYGGARRTRKAKGKSSEYATVTDSSKKPIQARPARAADSQCQQLGDSEQQALWKAQRRPRRNFTDEEDQALLKGFKEQGPSWITICKDEAFKKHGRTSTDLRDRLRTRFPEMYAEAGLASRPAVPRPAKRSRSTRKEPEIPAESTLTTTPAINTTTDDQSRSLGVRMDKTSSRTGPSYGLPLPSIDDSLSNFGFPEDDDDSDPIILDRSIMDWARQQYDTS